jgi:xeroderma pigmentosum group C-complementing protein
MAKEHSAMSKRKASTSTRNGAGSSRTRRDAVPQVFREMLQDEVAADIPAPRITKRRKIGSKALTADSSANVESFETTIGSKDEVKIEDDPPSQLPVQTVFDSSDDSEDENFEWEDVNITKPSLEEPLADEVDKTPETLSIIVGAENKPSTPSRRKARKPLTLAEKKMHLDIHKVHILCLLYHCLIRNHWCNDTELQLSLRRMMRIEAKLVSRLHPDPSAGQFQRSRVFKEALQELTTDWRNCYSITSQGVQRPHWSTPGHSPLSQTDTEAFMDKREFREHARNWGGSADYGAQLFCSLLRGLGVQTRLVCSLQVLPFTSIATVPTPVKYPGKTVVYAQDDEQDDQLSSPVNQSSPVRRIVRLGHQSQETHTQPSPASSSRAKRRNIPRPRHPVFWVEVFDSAYQKLIPIDPIATGTIGKPSNLEPGLNDRENLMSYVIAFEDTGVAKDVTRRYTKAYIAKTRKVRVEVSHNGSDWLARAMRPFKRGRVLDRDQVEDSQLLQCEISEGMPRNIEDFKGHPIYVLERHLRRDEVIYPKRETGKVNTGSKLNAGRLESVYRRQDVHIVKSGEKWFRLGRQIKLGEDALKRVPSRVKFAQDDNIDSSNLNDTGQETLRLYAAFQTELYIPPPVENGKIPKNSFGNIDVYVRSMIPPGAVHIKSKYSRQAARIIGIDYAEAVTGFRFQGRHGSAVVDGVVVAREYKDAMVAVLNGLAYAREQALEQQRTNEALTLWRRFLTGLKIVERVNAYKGEDEIDDDIDDEQIQEQLDADMNRFENLEGMNESTISDMEEVEVIEPLPVPTGSQSKLNPVAQNQNRIPEQTPAETRAVMDDDMESIFEEQLEKAQQESLEMYENGLQLKAAQENEQREEEMVAEDVTMESESQSLLSEDPDDIDAEPEWLD